MYHRILLTNDGSPLAAAAIPYAAAIAKTQGAEIVVLRVSHAAGARVESLDEHSWAQVIEVREPDIALEAEPLLRDIAAKLRADGVDRVGSLLLQGEPAETIVEAARRLGADLTVISSHGLSGLKRAVLGSTADYVARHVGAIPVLICHPLPVDVADPVERLLLPLDGSSFSAAALPHAEAIARGAAGCIVLTRAIDSVVAVLATSMPIDSGDGVVVPNLSVDAAERIVAEARGIAREEIVEVATELAMRGFAHVRLEIVEEFPVDAILATARRTDSHLIVMSTHGRGGLLRTLLGSVADQVTREFEGGAVLLVHPGAAE